MLKKCKYLLGLFVGLSCLFSFSNGYGLTGTSQASNLEVGGWVYFQSGYCYIFTSNGENVKIYTADGNVFASGLNNNFTQYCNNYGNGTVSNKGNSRVSYLVYPMLSECSECEQCPEIDTGSILSGSCDINYCVENGLCPTGTGSRSELVINDIVHEGKPLININIPDYIQWDYAVDENQYDIYVGSGYDQDYIDSVLKINSYRPDNKDFTQIFVSGLTLIFPYIFVALLIVFIWKLLKRIFR